jgi:hypothetical protein
MKEIDKDLYNELYAHKINHLRKQLISGNSISEKEQEQIQVIQQMLDTDSELSSDV